MIPEVQPRTISPAEHEAVRASCAVVAARSNVEELYADVGERVACRGSEREFKVVEASGRVRLFLLVSVDAEGKSHWLSRYVNTWTDTDDAIDDLIARAA